MSKLIREPESEQKDIPELQLPLSDSTVVTLLKACQRIASDHCRSAFKYYLKILDDRFNYEIRQARSNQDATNYAEYQRAINKNQSELERYFCGYVAEGFVKFKKNKLNTVVGKEDGNPDTEELSLVGNEDLEEAIAITTITQRADGYFAEPLWALNQRFAVLNGGEHVTESSNPAAPIQYCESLRKAIKLITLPASIKTLMYKVFDTQIITIVKLVTEDINHFLKSKGILPNLKYTLPSGVVPASYWADDSAPVAAPYAPNDRDENLSPEEYQASLLSAIRNLQDQMVAPPQVPAGSLIPITEQDIVNALQSMQGPSQVAAMTSDGQPLVPVDISVVAQQLQEQIQAQEKDASVGKNDMQTIDLVGMLFEYMLSDENLPDSIKALLSYLHTPFLKVAFIDPDFFENSDHPARVLLNNLAEAGARWVSNDGTSQFGIYERIQGVVNKILKDFKNDVKVITKLLLEFSSYTKSIVRRQELTEKRAMEKAQGEDKLREVKIRVNDEIRQRTENRELPSKILLFLLQPWSDYLSFALLRFGEDSDKWQKGIHLVDDLLWALEEKATDEDRQRQQEICDSLPADIEIGFSNIGFEQNKGRELIETIPGLVKMAMQSKKVEPAPKPLRNELERIAAEKAGDTEAEVRNEKMTPAEAKMVENLKMIEFGTWFELDGGRRLKVAWYNARTSHYMLVNQMGKRDEMMSGLELARKMLSKEAKVISGSSKPFFERALENILHKLNEKAESTQQDPPK